MTDGGLPPRSESCAGPDPRLAVKPRQGIGIRQHEKLCFRSQRDRTFGEQLFAQCAHTRLANTEFRQLRVVFRVELFFIKIKTHMF